MGQDGRWRALMVKAMRPLPGDVALDIAAGTGSITRLIQQEQASVISLDQSESMLAPAVARGATGVLASAECLPFPDARFDIVTFGYLLRYVGDVGDCMAEISRAVKPGGRVGMVEFGRPKSIWRPLWWLYTRLILPGAGYLAGDGWPEVGRFLGPSIEEFADRYPPEQLAAIWEKAGLSGVRFERLSLGGGLVMWAVKPARSGVAG